METTHYTTMEFVTKENGRLRYIDSPLDLPDDAMIAEVTIIKNRKTDKEMSRDQFVADDKWMTVAEYYGR